MGFGQSPHEAAIYRRGNGGNALLVGVYVDNLVITDTKDAEVTAFKEEMKVTFQMSGMSSLLLSEDRGAPGRLRDHASTDRLR
jgi:hypothetical protein